MSSESRSAPQPIRTAVVGAGAIGGLIAAAAVHAGHSVSVLARGKTLDALRSDGLKVIDGSREAVVRVNAGDAPDAFGVQDYVVIALKAQTLPAIAASLQPMIGPRTVIVAAMNGFPWWFTHDFAGPLDNQTIEAVDPGGSGGGG
ncbi:2-dehydropantoate 2-reductase N-terminal domain-containing protein, partial [Paraburkholderia sp. 2C]